MKNILKEKIDIIREEKDLEETKRELERILTEINNENSKIPSDDRIKEIVLGKKGKLEEARRISKDLGEDRRKRAGINGVKNLIITANIVAIMLPYVVCGTGFYFAWRATDHTPYHQNNHQAVQTVYEYWDSLGENKILTEEEMEGKDKNSITIYSPWQQNEKGEYFRNRFYVKKNLSNSSIEEVLNSELTDLLADYVFDDIELEKAEEKPEDMSGKFELIQKHKDYKRATTKENTKKQIAEYSITHLVATACGGTAILLVYYLLRGKNKKALFLNKYNELKEKEMDLYDEKKRTSMKEKVKELRKK